MRLRELRKGDFPEYYQQYIDYLPDEDLVYLLRSQKEEMLDFLFRLRREDLRITYGEDKWTVAEVLQHTWDTERIFQYRALCIARKDKTSFPGYDQETYVPASKAHERRLFGYIEEYEAIRNSGIALFRSFSSEMINEMGTSNGFGLTAAAAGFIIAGHEKHHLKLFQSRYGL